MFDTPKLSQITSVPNLISILRLALVPALFLLTVAEDWVVATLLAAFLGFTDFLDGYLARRFNLRTPLGSILDPIVDRFFVIGILGALVVANLLHIALAIIIVSRDLLVLLIGIVSRKDLRIQVTYLGKMGTWILYVSFSLMYLSQLIASEQLLNLAVSGIIWGAIAYWLAGLGYVNTKIQERL